MSRQSVLTLFDKYTRCEQCGAHVLKSDLSRFRILEDCKNKLCLECARNFFKEETQSERNVEKGGYFLCSICEKKYYTGAESAFWIAKGEGKEAYFDAHFKNNKDFICEFCNKTRNNYSHTAYIDENKQFSVSKLRIGANHPLPPETFLDCTKAGTFNANISSTSTVQSDDPSVSKVGKVLSKKNSSVQVTNYGADKSEITSEIHSFEIDVFSEEDFPFLSVSDAELNKSKRQLHSYLSRKSELEENRVDHELGSIPVIHLPPEYNKDLPPECVIENESPPPFLPEEIPAIYSVEELKASYNEHSLKVMNLHHVFQDLLKDKYDESLNNSFRGSGDLFSMCFSSSSQRGDSVPELSSTSVVPSSSNLSSKTEEKYPALRQCIAQLEKLSLKKNNLNMPFIKDLDCAQDSVVEPRSVIGSSRGLQALDTKTEQKHTDINRYQLEQLTKEQNYKLIPFINCPTDYVPALQYQKRKSAELHEPAAPSFIAMESEVDNKYHRLNNEPQSNNRSKMIHVTFQKQRENENVYRKPEIRFDNLVETTSSFLQNSMPFVPEEVIQSGNYSIIQQFQVTAKYNFSNNVEMLTGKELDAQQQRQSMKHLKIQSTNHTVIQTTHKNHFQATHKNLGSGFNSLMNTYLQPYKSIRSTSCNPQDQTNIHRVHTLI